MQTAEKTNEIELAKMLVDHVLRNNEVLDNCFKADGSRIYIDWHEIYDYMLGSPFDYEISGLLKPEAAAYRELIIETAKDQYALRRRSLRLKYVAFREKVRRSL